jgi:hypothetical protein
MAHDVFISYDLEDRVAADAVCTALEEKGVRCWYWPRNLPDNLNYDKLIEIDHDEFIKDAVSKSKLMVLILSSHSRLSNHVQNEVELTYAGNRQQIPIIPFCLDDPDYVSEFLSDYIGSEEYLDASTPVWKYYLNDDPYGLAPPSPDVLELLVARVRKRLQQLQKERGQKTRSAQAARAENIRKKEEARLRAEKKRPKLEAKQAASQPAARRFSGIFLNYRRDDSAGYAGRLSDDLVKRFGQEQIFVDVDNIEPGEDFVTVIENAVSSCEVLIAIIGRYWLSSPGETSRWLDDSNNYVRMEIAAALRRGIHVVPVLVQRATMPKPQDLPKDLKSLARRNAIELSDRRWRDDVKQLISFLEKVFDKR